MAREGTDCRRQESPRLAEGTLPFLSHQDVGNKNLGQRWSMISAGTLGTNDDYDSCLNCKQKAPLHLNLFGEYFQSIRILFKHCGHNRKNTNKEDCRVKSESEQIEQDCRAESESGQNFGPLSTTPPSPRAPPAGLLPPLQLPGPGDCKAGYLLPGKEQKPVNILPSATSWLQLE